MKVEQVVFSTQETADAIGVSKSTLLRWIGAGIIKDSTWRDGRGYRVWGKVEVDKLIEFVKQRNMEMGGRGKWLRKQVLRNILLI